MQPQCHHQSLNSPVFFCIIVVHSRICSGCNTDIQTELEIDGTHVLFVLLGTCLKWNVSYFPQCLMMAWHDNAIHIRRWPMTNRFPLQRASNTEFRFFIALGWHDDVIKWKHFPPRYWPYVREIHWSPMNSLHKGQWRGALILSLICAWINGSVNNRDAGDLRRQCAYYDVIVMTNYTTKSRLGSDLVGYVE